MKQAPKTWQTKTERKETIQTKREEQQDQIKSKRKQQNATFLITFRKEKRGRKKKKGTKMNREKRNEKEAKKCVSTKKRDTFIYV